MENSVSQRKGNGWFPETSIRIRQSPADQFDDPDRAGRKSIPRRKRCTVPSNRGRVAWAFINLGHLHALRSASRRGGRILAHEAVPATGRRDHEKGGGDHVHELERTPTSDTIRRRVGAALYVPEPYDREAR